MGVEMHESLFKYLAGLSDADGSLSFNFKRDQNRLDRYFYGLSFHLSAADAVDKKGFVASLPELTGFGSVTRYGANKQFVNWNVAKRSDIEMLLPRLIKHMMLKAKHWQWMLDFWRDHRGQRYSERTVSEEERATLTAACKESRRSRIGPLKPRNHPSWAWLAGYLDGDGCYTHRENFVNRGYWQWTSHVSAVAHINDIFILEFLQKSFGGIIVEQGQSDHVKVWRRALGFKNRDFALRFLPKIVRHSRLKKHKIEEMIFCMRERTSRNRPQRLSVPGPTGQATV
jgi:hypothetical protein